MPLTALCSVILYGITEKKMKCSNAYWIDRHEIFVQTSRILRGQSLLTLLIHCFILKHHHEVFYFLVNFLNKYWMACFDIWYSWHHGAL